jgi:wyosine [tRNA(Phe)-imidazoG37] synthetase (radical SAM superfamily)
MSLGIDPIPFKTCNWNCVYCQLGRTPRLSNGREEFFSHEEILAEVQTVLANQNHGRIDWLTFVGTGEPTLHGGLGKMLRRLKSLTNIPVAVITNGSLLYLPDVRRELSQASAVMPTLDAGNEKLYRRINRPHPRLSLDRHVDGLAAFRREFRGSLWVEVMLLRGLNDTVEALSEIAAALRRIQPDQVHINLPVRPPCQPWVQAPDKDGIARAVNILGEAARVVQPADGEFGSSGSENLLDALVGILMRHPMREEELLETLKRWAGVQIKESLAVLESSGRVQTLVRQGEKYWSYSGARYTETPSTGSKQHSTSSRTSRPMNV